MVNKKTADIIDAALARTLKKIENGTFERKAAKAGQSKEYQDALWLSGYSGKKPEDSSQGK